MAKRQQAFNVYRPRGSKWVWVDTVYFTDYTVDEARKSLIDHDGYPNDIMVKLDK